MFCRSAAIMVSLRIEQRVILKFLVKLKKSRMECLQMLTKVFGDNAMSRARLYEWYKRFAEGWEGVEDDECPFRSVSAKRTSEHSDDCRHGEHQ